MKVRLGLRLWILITLLILSLLSIFGMPPSFFDKGVLVTSVEANSTAFNQGFRQGQIIIAVDGEDVNNFEDFSRVIQNKYPSSKSVKTVFQTKEGGIIYFSNHTPEVTLSEIPSSRLKTGLDLSGGARALVKAKDQQLTSQEVQDLVSVTEQRLNVYGISDVQVSPVSDLSGENFMLVELAGATPGDLRGILEQQGRFEAKIEQCSQSPDGSWFCNFRFTIYLTQDAAERHADITRELEVNSTSQGNYLSERLDLYLDGQLVNSLLIGEGLKGIVTTQISISGSGSGDTRETAYSQAEGEMKSSLST
jgi:preprotein translocase subunit SecD